MIKRKALSTIVGNVLIIILAVIGAGIFLSVYLRNVRDIADRDLPLCVGIDLEMLWCIAFPANTQLPNGGYLDQAGLYLVVERLPGGEEIRDLRFKITDSDGKTHVERPVNVTVPGYKILADYRSFVEHSTKEAAVKPLDYSPNVPCEIAVSAVVGKSNTICAPTQEPIKCLFYIPGNSNAVPPTPTQIVPLCP